MTIAAIKYFDTHEFIKKSKEFGSSEDLAEYQVKQIEQAIETAIITVKEEIQTKELATKGDVRESELRLTAKIEQYRYDSLKFTVWTGIGVIIALGGMLAKGFHWF